MDNLQRLIDAYLRADHRRREEAVARMERIAEAQPMALSLPRRRVLSLAVDNTLLAEEPEVPGGIHDLCTAIGVSSVVQS